jgi:hypothetical protein
LVTNIDLGRNIIGKRGAQALADALKVNTTLMRTGIFKNGKKSFKDVDKLIMRNKRFRCLFLFDARRMLLSLMCADECGVVWPYLLESGDVDGLAAPDNLEWESIRPEFSEVVAERHRRRTMAKLAGVVASNM